MPPSALQETLLEVLTAAKHPRRSRKMEEAHEAPRCAHVKTNGVRCGSPAMNGRDYCWFHSRVHSPKLGLDQLPPLEDANGIQCALMQVTDAIVANEIELKRAALLLYALQIASANLKHVRFEPLGYDVEVEDPAKQSAPTASSPVPMSR